MNQGEGLAIAVRQARKSYRPAAGGRKDAVEDVTIEVARSSVHGLLGPNGAGKTTTIKMLLGLVRPSGGSFEILGVDARDPGARGALGYLPEQPYFPAQLTANEAMRLYGRLSGMDGAEIAVSCPALLEKVGLKGRERTQLSKFSRGMMQRLGIAQALLGDPDVLVLDEPASGLDPVGQRDVRNIMRELRERGTTILLSSHQLSEVESVCDEVTIVAEGKVAATGSLEDLLNQKGSSTVRARGAGSALPDGVAAIASGVGKAVGDTWTFEAPDESVRAVVDALDDAGWTLVSVEPTRDSLEDYFATMMAQGGGVRA